MGYGIASLLFEPIIEVKWTHSDNFVQPNAISAVFPCGLFWRVHCIGTVRNVLMCVTWFDSILYKQSALDWMHITRVIYQPRFLVRTPDSLKHGVCEYRDSQLIVIQNPSLAL